ncbi:MAG: hypothetical protein B7Y39_12750 [Bdellovibrio sp. 28-41-41]|nr:MAG: hypothetical protein B7Y39_12750 [Bdellovibrio sp. 28-41-41]
MVTMKRCFSIVFCALFLLQTSAFAGAEKTDNFDVSVYKKYKFSDLFLTENEISKLNDEERTAYMVSIIHLAEVIEISQNFSVGLHDRDGVSSTDSAKVEEFASNSSAPKIQVPEKLKALSLIFSGNDAQALIGMAARLFWSSKSSIKALFTDGKAVTSKLSVSELSWLEKKAVTNAAQLEVKAAKDGKAAIAAVKSTNKEIGIPRKAIDAEVKRIKNSKPLEAVSNKLVENEAKYAKLADDLAAAKKMPKPDQKKIAAMEKQLKTLATQQGKDYEKFAKLGGSRVELNRLTTEKSYRTGQKAFAVAGAGVLGYEIGGIGRDIYNSTGIGESVRAGVEKVKSNRKTKHKAINGEIVGEEVTDGIKKEEGYGCLFGGYPSKLVNFSGEIRCTEPKELSSTTSCSKAGKFKCNNYGLTEDGKGLDKELCINKGPLDSLTLRCSVKLAEVHDTYAGKLTQNSEEWMAYQNKVKEIVEKMEATPFMQDSEGRVRTILSYCQTTNDIQKTECEAVTTLLKHLGGNGHFQASQVRQAAEAQRTIDAQAGEVPAVDTGSGVPTQPAPSVPPKEVNATK